MRLIGTWGTAVLPLFSMDFTANPTISESSQRHQKADGSGALRGERASWFHQRAETQASDLRLVKSSNGGKDLNEQTLIISILAFHTRSALRGAEASAVTQKIGRFQEKCGLHPSWSAWVTQKLWLVLKQEAPAWSCKLTHPPTPRSTLHLSQQCRQDLEDVLRACAINLTWNHNHKSN